MLRLTREDPAPQVLRFGSPQRQSAEEQVAAIVEAGTPPGSRDFASLWTRRAVKNRLWSMHNGRCCYCERLRDLLRETDVEHFRPKAAVAEKTPERPGYWWLAYEWTNLFLACKACNEEYKKTHFPIRGKRATGPDDELKDEDACLLDPVHDDIDSAIGFDWVAETGSVFIYGVGDNSERTSATVRIVGLNRPSLARERWNTLSSLRRIAWNMIRAQQMENSQPYIERAGAEIRELTSRETAVPFVGMKRKFFRSYGLGEYVSTD